MIGVELELRDGYLTLFVTGPGGVALPASVASTLHFGDNPRLIASDMRDRWRLVARAHELAAVLGVPLELRTDGSDMIRLLSLDSVAA